MRISENVARAIMVVLALGSVALCATAVVHKERAKARVRACETYRAPVGFHTKAEHIRAAEARLAAVGYDVYDFRNPEPGDTGFQWSEVDPKWQGWIPEEFRRYLQHPISESGFGKDMRALLQSDVCILILPCGRRAHLEAGFAIGAGKPTAIYIPVTECAEPELMYKMADAICVSEDELMLWCARTEAVLA